ncbi:MAG: GAF domain-containing protein [Chloroflexi bacterium]|nr:GAF domain-containing protein [Chloroflexota bacterium]MBU1751810.1 GAF domain-containing protein [Chloroflexota bacterium]
MTDLERERYITELSVLNEMSQVLSSARELNDLLERVYQQVSRLFDTTNFYVATYEEGSDEWTAVFDQERGERQPRTRYKVGTGVTGHIIRTQKPVLLNTRQAGVEFEKARGIETLGPPSMCWMGVPLISTGKVVGVMAIQSYEQERLYSERDVALFSTIGAQIAVAIENLRLLAEARRWAQELEAINEVGRTITSMLDLDAVLRQIVDTTKAHFDYYFVDIALVEGDQIVFEDGSAIGTSDVRLERGSLLVELQQTSLVGDAVRTGQPVLVNDVLNDPRYYSIPALAATRSELTVPLVVKDRIIGVLDVQSDQCEAFGETDVALLQSLASQAGVAIENARLFQRQERRITEMAILNEISRSVSAALRLDDLLETIYQQVTRLFDTTNFFISLYHEDTGERSSPIHLEHGQRQPVVQRRAVTGLTGYIIHHRQPVLLHTVRENLNFKQTQGIAGIGELAKSWLGVPLLVANKIVGVMTIQSYEYEHLYSEQDLALFATIAAQAAIAIENARLFDEAQRLAATITELSTPVIQIWDQVLVLPLIGGIDQDRSRQIMETLLEGITQHQARVVIIDVTGVPIIDSWVANHLLHTAQATELLGARCVLTGISPDIAQSIVGLDLPLTKLTTLPNVQAGIRYALALLRRTR